MTHNWIIADDSDFGSGIHLRSRRGQIGTTWWSRKWLEVIEQAADPSELELGRRLARKSQVLELRVKPGSLIATVNETRDACHECSLSFPQLSPAQWESVQIQVEPDAYALALLFANRLPERLEKIFEEFNVELIPAQLPPATCNCEIELTPCRHLIAMGCAMAERLDEQPLELFQLHGLSKEEWFDGIRESWGIPPLSNRLPELPTQLEKQLTDFYKCPYPLPTNSGTLDLPETTIFEALGTPPFFPASDQNMQQILSSLYKV